MTKVLLSLLEIVHGVDDFVVNNGAEVIVYCLSFLPLVVGEVELLTNDSFSGLEGFPRVRDVSIFTEVWDEVIDLVAPVLSLVLVLSAAGRVADWIRMDISIKLDVDVFLLVVESGPGWANWCLYNVDFLSFIAYGLVSSWLGRWIFHLLDKSNTDWLLFALLASLLEISIFLTLDSDLLIKEFFRVETGHE